MIDRSQIRGVLDKSATLEGKPIQALRALAADAKVFDSQTAILSISGFEQLIKILAMPATPAERQALTPLKYKFIPIELLILNQLVQAGIFEKTDSIKSKLALLNNQALFALSETFTYLLKNKTDFNDFYLEILKRSLALTEPQSIYSIASMRVFRYLYHTELLNPENLKLYFAETKTTTNMHHLDETIQSLYHSSILNQTLFTHLLTANHNAKLTDAIKLLSKTGALTAHIAEKFIDMGIKDEKSLPNLTISLTYLKYANYLNKSNSKAVLSILLKLKSSLPAINKILNKLKMAGNLTIQNAEDVLNRAIASVARFSTIDDKVDDSKLLDRCTIPLPHCLMMLEGAEKVNLQWDRENGGIKQICTDAKRAAGNRRSVKIAGLPVPLESIEKLQERLKEHPEITLDELRDEPVIQFLSENLSAKGLEQFGWNYHQNLYSTPGMMLANLAAYLNPDIKIITPAGCESTYTDIRFNQDTGLTVTTLVSGLYQLDPDDLEGGVSEDINQYKRYFPENPKIKLKLNLQSTPGNEDKITQYHFITTATTDNLTLAKNLFYSFCKTRKKQLLDSSTQKSSHRSAFGLFTDRDAESELLIQAYNSESTYVLSYDNETFSALLAKMSKWPNHCQYVDQLIATHYLQERIEKKIKEIQQVQMENDQYSWRDDTLALLAKNQDILAKLSRSLDEGTALGQLAKINIQLNDLHIVPKESTLKFRC